ncbi:MAG: hypothetical protein IH599_06395 [Bacteroidales bacterium]|nr:hypothetical protein [Bacteroidales bacterium]
MNIVNSIPGLYLLRNPIRTRINLTLRLVIPGLLACLLLSSCSTTNYPTPSSSSQQKHIKKSQKKYGKENPKNLRIKSNYKIKG